MSLEKIEITTFSSIQLIDITDQIDQVISKVNIKEGICYLFNPHTTAGLTINEGADPTVKDDIISGFQKMIPMHYAYKHLEGNSPAHIMTSLMGSTLTIFIENGQLALGTWQKIFFCEFDGPRSRSIQWRVIPTSA
ncbi:MAG: secondary thiamine-phosphate synthase enzyme YjbQ [Proteobacteria bacterium]|jgi:secondary thiamine-phosphate synthase enzyme|nr:YjbQ family protein [Desulfocapsa sp.]MBU3945137.1 secondary thiamine-phosphate synthase enzyme YjbQ [Pseudomonadota bacterium]MCG2743150.1 secondary thiamine-phosphate synthase enzyme YjbQ [Desulfobacteraceae bacterium]MBU4028607.1 secondary thiamine-phosphate synthase enzyme YjbQ [Pseudomonadota bacterium]MBU4043534.1 secondary thiamine-phosphate synthase enzyme YjbQ [Pseudomonadota bacterium]